MNLEDPASLLLVGLTVLTVILLMVLLLRRPRFDTPADLAARMALLEQNVSELLKDVNRSGGDLNRQHETLEDMKRSSADNATQLVKTVDEKLKETLEEGRSGRKELTESFSGFETRQNELVKGLQETVIRQLQVIAQNSTQTAEQLRNTLNERLASIQADNSKKLDEMRQTVDEKLQTTLEQRLGESFRLVSERLEQVHNGLGEMKNLAGSVGDLKKVMTNVRNRGTWGEMQLGSIIESLLTPDQYARNVKTVPGSNELVEFAVRMPGQTDDTTVWLPVDSKYPVEDYHRLQEAHESMDKVQIQQAANAFESSLRNEAKKIAAKYVSPPHTTDFAILFVPTESLFAEALRVPGLAEALQNDYRVVISGPTTLAAMLNSLRVGFRTLAIEKRSSEVWSLLGTVKTEFRKFGDAVESTKKSIDAAANKFDELGRRTRAIERGLRNVEELPASESSPALVQRLHDDDD